MAITIYNPYKIKLKNDGNIPLTWVQLRSPPIAETQRRSCPAPAETLPQAVLEGPESRSVPDGLGCLYGFIQKKSMTYPQKNLVNSCRCGKLIVFPRKMIYTWWVFHIYVLSEEGNQQKKGCLVILPPFYQEKGWEKLASKCAGELNHPLLWITRGPQEPGAKIEIAKDDEETQHPIFSGVKT